MQICFWPAHLFCISSPHPITSCFSSQVHLPKKVIKCCKNSFYKSWNRMSSLVNKVKFEWKCPLKDRQEVPAVVNRIWSYRVRVYACVCVLFDPYYTHTFLRGEIITPPPPTNHHHHHPTKDQWTVAEEQKPQTHTHTLNNQLNHKDTFCRKPLQTSVWSVINTSFTQHTLSK